jgi:hypothetical protein
MTQYGISQSYLMSLCQSHPQVAHLQTVDGKVRNSFFRFSSEEELIAKTIANAISVPAVGCMNVEGRIRDEGNAMEVIRHGMRFAWVFLDKVNVQRNLQTANSLQTAYDTTFGIMEDFIRAMKDEFGENGTCGAFTTLDLNSFNYQEFGPTSDNLFGWILYFDAGFRAHRIMDGSIIEWNPSGGYINAIEPEVIHFEDEIEVSVSWTESRKLKYGLFPTVQVYLLDPDGKYYRSAVQPYLDAPPPDFTQFIVSLPGNSTGFIVIK